MLMTPSVYPKFIMHSGPVVVLHKFSDEDDVVAKANDTELVQWSMLLACAEASCSYGLYAAVYTQNIDRALRVAKRLEAGTVGVNCTSPSGAKDVVFGGIKQSGIGREKYVYSALVSGTVLTCILQRTKSSRSLARGEVNRHQVQGFLKDKLSMHARHALYTIMGHNTMMGRSSGF